LKARLAILQFDHESFAAYLERNQSNPELDDSSLLYATAAACNNIDAMRMQDASRLRPSNVADAFSKAAIKGHIGALGHILAEHGGRDIGTAYAKALLSRRTGIVELLRPHVGQPELHRAAVALGRDGRLQEMIEHVDLLLLSGYAEHPGALHCLILEGAVSGGDWPVIRYLMDRIAPDTIEVCGNYQILLGAVLSGNPEVAAWFLQHSTVDLSPPRDLFHDVIDVGPDMPTVKQFACFILAAFKYRQNFSIIVDMSSHFPARSRFAFPIAVAAAQKHGFNLTSSEIKQLFDALHSE
jgi:hypothetical protein